MTNYRNILEKRGQILTLLKELGQEANDKNITITGSPDNISTLELSDIIEFMESMYAFDNAGEAIDILEEQCEYNNLALEEDLDIQVGDYIIYTDDYENYKYRIAELCENEDANYQYYHFTEKLISYCAYQSIEELYEDMKDTYEDFTLIKISDEKVCRFEIDENYFLYDIQTNIYHIVECREHDNELALIDDDKNEIVLCTDVIDENDLINIARNEYDIVKKIRDSKKNKVKDLLASEIPTQFAERVIYEAYVEDKFKYKTIKFTEDQLHDLGIYLIEGAIDNNESINDIINFACGVFIDINYGSLDQYIMDHMDYFMDDDGMFYPLNLWLKEGDSIYMDDDKTYIITYNENEKVYFLIHDGNEKPYKTSFKSLIEIVDASGMPYHYFENDYIDKYIKNVLEESRHPINVTDAHPINIADAFTRSSSKYKDSELNNSEAYDLGEYILRHLPVPLYIMNECIYDQSYVINDLYKDIIDNIIDDYFLEKTNKDKK